MRSFKTVGFAQQKKKFDPLLAGFKSSMSGVAKFNDTGGDDSLQPISRVYTSHFDNGMARLKPPVEVVLKKVPGTVHSGRPPKSEPDRIVPYHAVEKNHYTFNLIVSGLTHLLQHHIFNEEYRVEFRCPRHQYVASLQGALLRPTQTLADLTLIHTALLVVCVNLQRV